MAKKTVSSKKKRSHLVRNAHKPQPVEKMTPKQVKSYKRRLLKHTSKQN